jgi:hypothetical protein
MRYLICLAVADGSSTIHFNGYIACAVPSRLDAFGTYMFFPSVCCCCSR